MSAEQWMADAEKEGQVIALLRLVDCYATEFHIDHTFGNMSDKSGVRAKEHRDAIERSLRVLVR